MVPVPCRATPPAKPAPQSLTKLLVCVSGIYLFFLTWGILQERISTISYTSTDLTVPPGRFQSFIFLNMLQSVVAAVIAYGYLRVSKQSVQEIFADRHRITGFGRVTLTGCLASPFGYAALKHISYPTMILSKSCKLLPVMLMNVLVYRRRFDAHKYATVLLITVGVAGFMFFEPASASKPTKGASSYGPFGLVLLLVNLLLDGATNSAQDAMFARHRVSAQQMMFFMNLFSACYLASFLVASNWYNGELAKAFLFISNYPKVLYDITMFCTCGALGQVFIFATIEHFGSLVLVTVTVTRKLFTILLSLFWFNHRLAPAQWASVALVFAALGIESFYKKQVSHAKSD